MSERDSRLRVIVAPDNWFYPHEISQIKLILPEIDRERENGFYKPYELPTDAGIDRYDKDAPLTKVKAKVLIKKKNGNEEHAPPGTKIKIGYQNHTHHSDGMQGNASFLSLSGHPLKTDIVEVKRDGICEFLFEGSTRALRWKINGNKITDIKPDTFVITAAELSGKVTTKSKKITIVAGKPQNIKLLDGPKSIGYSLKKIKAPNNKPLQKDDKIGKVKGIEFIGNNESNIDNDEKDIRLGGTRCYKHDPIFGGRSLFQLVCVTDKYKNPVKINIENEEGSIKYRSYVKVKTLPEKGTRPLILCQDGRTHDVSRTPAIDRKIFKNFPRLRGLFGFHYIPSYDFVKVKHEIEVGVSEGSSVAQSIEKESKWIFTKPHETTNKIYEWLVKGITDDTALFVLDIAVSLIPIIGDVKDIVAYGYKKLTNRITDKWDDIIFAISCASLGVDVSVIISGGGTAPLLAVSKGGKALFLILKKLVKPIRHLLDSRLRGVPEFIVLLKKKIMKAFQLAKDKQPSLESVKKLLGELWDIIKAFTERIARNQKSVKNLIAIMSFAVMSAQLLEAVLKMITDNMSDEEICDLLYFAGKPDGGQIPEFF